MMRFLVSILFLGCAFMNLAPAPASAASCSDVAALLVADGGVWKAVNENRRRGATYERVFKFAAVDGKIQGSVVKPLRDERITAVEVSDGKVVIRFSDERGNHLQRYACKDNPAALTGRAEGPRPGGDYDHDATLTKQ